MKVGWKALKSSTFIIHNERGPAKIRTSRVLVKVIITGEKAKYSGNKLFRYDHLNFPGHAEETLFLVWSKDGGGRNWVCNWSNCRGNREVALRHDLLASGEASAEYENKPGMGKN